MKKEKVLWFTGLSGSGKTTLAKALKKKMEEQGLKVKLFDGDEIRKLFYAHLGYDKKDIEFHHKFIIRLCSKNLSNFDFIFVSVISPFERLRNLVKTHFQGQFLTIYVQASLKTCMKRDVKGLYQRALKKEIQSFIGIEIPYEVPKHPDLILNTEKFSVNQCLKKVLNHVL